MPLFMQHAILIMIVLRTGRVKLDQFLDIMEVSLCRDSTKHTLKGLHENRLFSSKVRKKYQRESFVLSLTEHIFVSEHSVFSFQCENVFAGT
jgi:hypothetical protein